VQTLDEVIAHPQTEATGMLQTSADGTSRLFGLPIEFDGERPPFRLKPPKLGEATDIVLKSREGVK
jgi:crotonobetainyl-CoA:carnitine CoA-transferase CaiB-like acyl-CoA transferase